MAGDWLEITRYGGSKASRISADASRRIYAYVYVIRIPCYVITRWGESNLVFSAGNESHATATTRNDLLTTCLSRDSNFPGENELDRQATATEAEQSESCYDYTNLIPLSWKINKSQYILGKRFARDKSTLFVLKTEILVAFNLCNSSQ